jgi:hypothetical protein
VLVEEVLDQLAEMLQRELQIQAAAAAALVRRQAVLAMEVTAALV